MVEVDIQFLAGVAATVFLALMFFGVVVLWDVALALRSVGDKIDKLEDNVDDDLKDIGYSLDSISNAPGGSGAQFHLSGGTISSEPTPNQRPTDETQSRGEHPSPSREEPRSRHQRSTRPETEAARERTDDVPSESQAADSTTESKTETEAETAADTDPEAGDELSDDPDALDPDSNLESDESDYGSESDPDPNPDPESTPDVESEHPRASINRGRFVTSPDRRAWYAIPLDRDAVANAGPVIAGELEAGEPDAESTDASEPEVIAAGPAPVGDSSGSEPEFEAESKTGDEADDPVGADKPGTEATSDELGTDTDTNTDFDFDSDSDSDETSEFEGSTAETTDAGSAIGDSDDTVNDLADGELSDGATGSASNAPPADRDSDRTDSDDRESDRADGDAERFTRSESESESDIQLEFEADSEPISGREVEAESESKAERERELDSESDSRDSTSSDADLVDADDTENSLDTDTDRSAADTESFTDFEFSDLAGEPDGDGTERTVDEAIDSMNDETPSLSLSSHGFEVTAEADDDGAVLIFEFDPDTVEITGSTKRLLRYQMRSFAEQESTPDGDVTIDGNTILIELPEADGDAVSRWGEAAVGIIDRTLYLSDNSN